MDVRKGGKVKKCLTLMDAPKKSPVARGRGYCPLRANGIDLTVGVMIRYRRSYGPVGLLRFALAG